MAHTGLNTAGCLGLQRIYNFGNLKNIQFWKNLFLKVKVFGKKKNLLSRKIYQQQDSGKTNFTWRNLVNKEFENWLLQIQQTMDFYPRDQSAWLLLERILSTEVWRSINSNSSTRNIFITWPIGLIVFMVFAFNECKLVAHLRVTSTQRRETTACYRPGRTWVVIMLIAGSSWNENYSRKGRRNDSVNLQLECYFWDSPCS